VYQSSESTKSSGMMLCTGLAHWICGYFSLSSTRNEIPAAVKALVVLPTAKCVCSVTDLLLDMSETPKPYIVYDNNMSISADELYRITNVVRLRLTLRKVSFPVTTAIDSPGSWK